MIRVARCVSALLLAGFLPVAPGDAHAGAPEARILWTDGRVTLEANPGEAQEGAVRPAEVLDPVGPDEQLVVAPGGGVWLRAHEELIHVVGPGVWRWAEDGLETVDGPDGAGGPPRSVFDLAGLPLDAAPVWRVGAREEARCQPPGAARLSPAETAIGSRRPTLRWRPEPDVSRWDLLLSRLDDTGEPVPVERWEGLAATAHPVSRDLEPGVFYRWGVEPSGGGEGGAVAWFQVLSEGEWAEVSADMEALDGLRAERAEAEPAVGVLRAWTLEGLGLLEGAETAWMGVLARVEGDGRRIRERLERLGRRELVEPRERPRMREVAPPAMCPDGADQPRVP